MPKRFTLAEAQTLIPSVEPLLRKAIELKSTYDSGESAIEKIGERITMAGGLTVNRDQVLEARRSRDRAAAALRTVIEEVQEFGCVVKDLDTGLIDFPTFYQGQEVYLCWKLGESAIAFWHGVDEGFAGRKPIDQDFRQNHEGDRAH